MPIACALLLYGVNGFHLYILEKCEISITIKQLRIKEDSWSQLIKPSYNIQSILNPFLGNNHYRYGKTLSTEIRQKISNSLTGSVQSKIVRNNHSIRAHKRQVFCYDYTNQQFVTEFAGIRIMARELKISSTILIYSHYSNKPFKCTYKDKKVLWLITSTVLKI
jgi:NUMOD3 motif